MVRAFFLRSVFLIPLAVSCQVEPYAPPPQQVVVESIEIDARDFHGRPEAFATIKGRLSTTAAQLVDAKQSREGNLLFIEVLEQTPRGANLIADLAEAPSFTTKIPIELLGLEPGLYTVSANGVTTTLELPSMMDDSFSYRSSSTPASSSTTPGDDFPESTPSPEAGAEPGSPTPVTDELIPIEDSSFIDPTSPVPVP